MQQGYGDVDWLLLALGNKVQASAAWQAAPSALHTTEQGSPADVLHDGLLRMHAWANAKRRTSNAVPSARIQAFNGTCAGGERQLHGNEIRKANVSSGSLAGSGVAL
jgi:hypothetical protein